MALNVVRQCDYCQSLIGDDQRWVREKIYDPGDLRAASYHHFHAEPFPGQTESCWEKHQMERELARTAA